MVTSFFHVGKEANKMQYIVSGAHCLWPCGVSESVRVSQWICLDIYVVLNQTLLEHVESFCQACWYI